MTSANIDRVDVLVGERPLQSYDVTGSPMTVQLPMPLAAGATLSARGYRQNTLVASARA